MTLKEKIENNLTLYTLGLLFAGFVAGIGAYKGIIEIAGPQWHSAARAAGWLPQSECPAVQQLPPEATEATFEYPAPNANIALKTQLRGTVKPAIPQDGGRYWLVIRDDDGDHYPQAEIAAMPNGTWTHPLALGPKWRGRPVDVLVVFARNEQANEVLHKSVGGEGLSRLPNHVVPLATLNLTAQP